MTRVVSIAQSGSNNVTMRNRLINGGMVIDQRNAGASVTITGTDVSQYVLDRWFIRAVSAAGSKISTQQSTTSPTGFVNSQVITSLSAYTIGSTEHFATMQSIEGFNASDFAWGTASAQSITVSFQVRSSLTGTFGGFITNSAGNRCYVFSYTINAANTFETKTITIAGDQSGTWLTNNGVGLTIAFNVAAGSSTTTTAGSWGSTLYRSVTGQTSLVGTSGATFYITGVQLEAGTTATPFEQRLYGTELALCQRYYCKSYSIGVVPGTATDSGAVENGIGASVPTTGSIEASTTFKVSMRASPTITLYDRAGNSGKVSRVNPGVSSTDNQTTGTNFIGENGFCSTGSGVSACTFIYQYKAEAEL